jgi:hypothetical protein
MKNQTKTKLIVFQNFEHPPSVYWVFKNLKPEDSDLTKVSSINPELYTSKQLSNE